MKFSKYVHSFYVDKDSIGLYHALLVEVVFVNQKELDNIRKYIENKESLGENIKPTIKYLYEHYFIIDSDIDDDNLLSKCISLITPPFISNAYIITTDNCNFNCKYCFITEAINANEKEGMMNDSVARATVALLQRTYEKQQNIDSEKVITFYGGEPLLNFNAIKVVMEEIEHIKKIKYWPKDVRYTVITNGSLLTSDIIDFFRNYNISIGISYDGNREAHSHRINRNADETYNVVKDKITLCKQKGVSFTLSMTITNDLIKNQKEVLSDILQIKPPYVSFNLLIPSKNQKQNDDYYKNATDLIINMFKVLRDKGIYEDRIMRKVQAFSNNALYLYDCCAAGGNQYVISPSGKIGICHAYLNNKKYFGSSVFDTNFDHTTDPNFIHWHDRTPLLMNKCKDCACIGICGGGCPYAAEYIHGSIYDIDDRFCIHTEKILSWLIRDLYENMNSKT